MKIILSLSLMLSSLITFGQDEISVDPKTGRKVIYTYKDNEKLIFFFELFGTEYRETFRIGAELHSGVSETVAESGSCARC